MLIEEIKTILANKYPQDLVDVSLKSYIELKENFLLGKFKPTELEGGFFVECIRRILEIELFSRVIPLGVNLSKLNDSEIKRYENATGDDAFRIHIPRVLLSIYGMRNKRGVGHLSTVSPNIMDSAYIIASCDWVLAEVIRQISTLPSDECQGIIDSLVQRKIPIVFEVGDNQRVLDPQMKTKDKVLVLLHHNSCPISVDDLLKWTEYSHSTNFKSILRHLHQEKNIEFSQEMCQLTPKGTKYVEDLLKKSVG